MTETDITKAARAVMGALVGPTSVQRDGLF